MDNTKYKILSAVLLILSLLSILFTFLYGWPLIFVLFLPGLYFTRKPKVNTNTENHCINCGSVISPAWTYCPYCSSKAR